MNSGNIDKRTLVLDVEWISPEDSEPSDGEHEDEEILDFYGNDGDDEDESNRESEETNEEQEEDESETDLSPPPSKRKRPAEPLKWTAAPPKKRVTFDLQKPVRVTSLPQKPGHKSALVSKKQR